MDSVLGVTLQRLHSCLVSIERTMAINKHNYLRAEDETDVTALLLPDDYNLFLKIRGAAEEGSNQSSLTKLVLEIIGHEENVYMRPVNFNMLHKHIQDESRFTEEERTVIERAISHHMTMKIVNQMEIEYSIHNQFTTSFIQTLGNFIRNNFDRYYRNFILRKYFIILMRINQSARESHRSAFVSAMELAFP
jgi:hypothetical protein